METVMGFLERLADGSLTPQDYSLLWQDNLLLLNIAGNLVTAIAFFVIPVALIRIVRYRKDLYLNGIFLMFALSIFSCGITQILGIVNVWHDYHFLAGLFKTLTGIISIITAAMVWHLIPKIIAIPSKEQLLEKVRALEEAEASLVMANVALESKIEARTRQLELLAKTDELTGLSNRREILARLSNELDRAKRYRQPLSIQILDVDKFKEINDNHGHKVGDKVLSQFARTISTCTRDTDFIGRIGGEEFLIIMPSTGIGDAEFLAERLRANVSRQTISIGNIYIKITCSIGLAEIDPDDIISSLLHRADQAMYKAKTQGRNQVNAAR